MQHQTKILKINLYVMLSSIFSMYQAGALIGDQYEKHAQAIISEILLSSSNQ